MKESIGQSWTIQIVAAFILLFVAFLTLMISYSKCFKTKNEVISIIEKYEGMTSKSEKIIKDFLVSANYKGYGNCPTGYKGYEQVKNNRFKYCIKPNMVSDATLVYYDVIMFYSFNLAAFGNIMTFEVKGRTIDLSSKYVSSLYF